MGWWTEYAFDLALEQRMSYDEMVYQYLAVVTDFELCEDIEDLLTRDSYVHNDFTDTVCNIWMHFQCYASLSEKQRNFLARHIQIACNTKKDKQKKRAKPTSLPNRFESEDWGIDFMGNYYRTDFFEGSGEEVPNFGFIRDFDDYDYDEW